MSLIQVTDANYWYRTGEEQGIHALRDINLSIEKGEFVVIIGHNGSGKSTLAKLLNGLLTPDTGTVTINGRSTLDPEHYWQIRQQVGMVFQNPDNQLIATVVEEDVAFGPENLGVPSVQIVERVRESLRQVDMTKYSRHAPHLLSGGQKQRVAIAGILAMRPRCLVLDEPTAMLDPRGRREVLKTVRQLNARDGMTAVWITHHMDEAAHADRVLVMEQGAIVMQGKPKDVFRQTERLKNLDLDVPVITRLGQLLAEDGLDLPDDILTVDEMVMHLCQ
ncbi:MAG: energy-coupling factor transporter ATPase [Firmicutes bacterium]|nr:energy-coupling factor transporter ATPase [Bacillota bacterium]